ncbi:MAG TPA: Ig-like domain repeat protein, partial [Thermoanaerobaculia bacterium]|nr:Ig-like domain repeat protein [Thermoanaerobaculia bacterium]
FDAGGNYDGGVIEMSVNGGAFTDIGSSVYNGTIFNGGSGNPNPLRGRVGWVKNSAGTIHTSLTQAIAPTSTVQFRLRLGADGGFGAAGWDVDNIAVTGVVETPNATVIADTGCSVATTTSITPSANPSPAGSSLTLTATVNSASGAPNSGTVTFLDAGSPIGTGPVSAGVATFSTSSLSAGSHTLSARFEGIPGFLPSTSPTYTQTIGTIATTSVVVASVSRSNFSRPVTFTATVTGTTGTPTGTVTFFDGVNTLGSIALSAGSAAYTTSGLPVGPHSITVQYGGNGTYAASVSVATLIVVETNKTDFTAEGRSDIVLQNSSTNSIAAWNMNGSTLTAGAVVGTPVAGWLVRATGDLEGDGNADIILQNTSTGAIAEWRMNGLSMTSGTVITTTSTDWRIAGTYDFDHDAKADIIVQNNVTREIRIWIMNGAVISSNNSVGTPIAGWKVITGANIGGDALVLQNTSSNFVARWSMNGATMTGGVNIGLLPANTNVIASGDFTLDGVDDLVLQNTSTRDVTIWSLNSSAAITGNNLISTPVAGWAVLGTGDYDANGRADLLLQNSISNSVAMWQTDGVTLLSGAVVTTPAAGYKPIVN